VAIDPMSRAVVELRLARRSPCPHCGHKTKTVQGVCADCWGSKEEGRRQFFFRKRRTSSAWFSPDDVLILFSVAVGMGVIYVLMRSI
jgi:hypothetical protein